MRAGREAPDVERSAAFYRHLGFTPKSIYKYRDMLAWAALESRGAQVMFERSDPVDPERQNALDITWLEGCEVYQDTEDPAETTIAALRRRGLADKQLGVELDAWFLTTHNYLKLAAALEAGQIEDGSPGPRQEMRVVDPDGYVVMVPQIED